MVIGTARQRKRKPIALGFETEGSAVGEEGETDQETVVYFTMEERTGGLEGKGAGHKQ